MAETLQKTGPTAIVKRESFVSQGDLTGTEEIRREEIVLPRLAIAQGLSPQMTPGSSEHIKGLEQFTMFNNLTSEKYGNGPLRFVPIRRDVRRIEFDRTNRSIPVDLHVPHDDVRMQWTTDEHGKKQPPRAVTFNEFIGFLLKSEGELEPIVMSIKRLNKWNRRAADRLTSFIKLRRKPIYAGYYSIESKPEKNDKGTFGVFVIKNDGSLDDPEQTDVQWEMSQKIYHACQEFYKGLEGKEIEVVREAPTTDDFEVDPETDDLK